VTRQFRFGWEKEEIFGNTILWSDVMKLDLGMNVYEEINDKKKLKK